MKVLYLHGFRSSPASFKAQMLADALTALGKQDDWHCPQLPASPAAAIALANQWIQTQFASPEQAGRGLTIMGSSLGGYYATVLAERWQCRAVVLNPVVHAARDLATQVGRHTHYHSDVPFEFLPQHVTELAEMAVPPPADATRYYLLAATGDEVLNWRDMTAWYAGSLGHVIQGSNHGISDFADWLPDILAFVFDPARP